MDTGHFIRLINMLASKQKVKPGEVKEKVSLLTELFGRLKFLNRENRALQGVKEPAEVSPNGSSNIIAFPSPDRGLQPRKD